MNGTLYSLEMLDTPFGFAAAGLLGMLFGFFLEQAGFGSSRRLTGLFYFRDMAVVKVMFTAVVTALIGRQYLEALGLLRPTDLYLLDTYWGAQIVGGLVFGVGFVVGGWCPGTAFVGLASMKWDALVFLVGALLGSVLFNETFAMLRPLYEGGHAGVLHLAGTLGVPVRGLVIGFAVAAVLMFALCTWVESWLGGQPKVAGARRRNHRLAGALMVALAAGTLLLPSAPAGRDAAKAAGPVAPAAVAGAPALAEVDAALDHVDAPDLADALMRGVGDWTVVDIRTPDEYAAFHIRGAVNVPLAELASDPQRIPRSGTVVLYSNGTTHAAQAWLALRQRGWANVRVLTDGILGFWRECLTPPSLTVAGRDPSAAQAQSAAYAARRAFFLPAPQAQPPTAE